MSAILYFTSCSLSSLFFIAPWALCRVDLAHYKSYELLLLLLYVLASHETRPCDIIIAYTRQFIVRKIKKKICQNSKIQCNIHITFYLNVLTNFSSHLSYLSLQWVPVVIIMPQQNVLIMHFTVLQGFSQDFRIGCPKIQIWGELGVQKYTVGVNWVSNSFSSHIHKKYGY